MRRSVRLLACSTVLCTDYPHARHIVLNNPKSLNALDFDMTKELHRLYVTEPAPDSALYIIKGAGSKAFCSGGDVIGVTTNNPPGCARSFFYWEYQLDYRVSRIPSGQVCLWAGYALGGGAGLSIGSAYRVASEKACVALPEVAIGMIPDVGASWFLPRMPTPGLGMYMGLTGRRLRGADLVHLGIATHFVPSAKMSDLEKDLLAMTDAAQVTRVLERHATPVAQLPPCTVAASFPFLQEHFACRPELNVPDILAACRAHAGADPLAKAAADVMPTFSPTALTLALEVLKRGAQAKTLVEAFQMEYCASQHVVAEHEFREGVRALLIDKDKRPKWRPATLAEVTRASIDAYFIPTTPDQPVWDPLKPLPPAAV